MVDTHSHFAPMPLFVLIQVAVVSYSWASHCNQDGAHVNMIGSLGGTDEASHALLGGKTGLYDNRSVHGSFVLENRGFHISANHCNVGFSGCLREVISEVRHSLEKMLVHVMDRGSEGTAVQSA